MAISVENVLEKTLWKVVEELKLIAKTSTVVGEPIEVGEFTIIPVSKVCVGFGGGGGEDCHKKGGSGGGSGGGTRIDPKCFIVIHKDEIKILTPKGEKGAFDKVFETIPEIVEKIKISRAKAEEGKE